MGNVERSLAFYHGVLGPLGLKEKFRVPTYRQTEEVVYLEHGVQGFGLRPADGGAYRYHDVGIKHPAFEVDDRAEVDAAYQRCVAVGGTIQSPPDEHYVYDGEDYCGFFAFDPDGIRIEVFCWPSSPNRGSGSTGSVVGLAHHMIGEPGPPRFHNPAERPRLARFPPRILYARRRRIRNDDV